ncbi:MAG: DMT family transporter [Tannerella sp.]|jgi:drug/metabolite transporter (DMT)-like permease|nr:DMT family transporter [Tannerella sp.]
MIPGPWGKEMKTVNRSLIYALIAIFSWSTVAASFKTALKYYSHFEVLLVAALTAFFILATVTCIRKKWSCLSSLSKKQWGKYALIGLLNPVAYYLVLFRAYDLLPAQIAQPVNYLWPMVLSILLAVITRKAILPVKYIGMALSLSGVAIISYGSGGMQGESLPLSGLLPALLSAFLWAVFWIVNKTNEQADGTVSLLLIFFFGSVYLLAASFFMEVNLDSPEGALAGAYVGTFEMAIPFIFFRLALKETDNPVLINQLCYLSPFLSLFIIHFVLGEDISVTTFAGLFLIVFGIIFNEYIANRIKSQKVNSNKTE